MTDTGKLYWSAIKTFGVDLQLKAREERGDNREHTAHWEDPGQKGDLWYAKLNGPGPDPKGARGAWGHCPKCGASDCEWDAETDVCTCKACGYTN